VRSSATGKDFQITVIEECKFLVGFVGQMVSRNFESAFVMVYWLVLGVISAYTMLRISAGRPKKPKDSGVLRRGAQGM
jgi:hypothetical protein